MGPNQPPRSNIMTPLKGFFFNPVTHFLGHLWHVLHVLLSCTHISFLVFPRSHRWRKFGSTYKIETSTDGSIGSIILESSWLLNFAIFMGDVGPYFFSLFAAQNSVVDASNSSRLYIPSRWDLKESFAMPGNRASQLPGLAFSKC